MEEMHKFVDRMNKRIHIIQQHFTTSLSIYAIVLGLSVLLIVIGLLVEPNIWQATSQNVGCGIFGSLCVALLIDLSNTKRQREENLKNADELSLEYRMAFREFRDAVLDISDDYYGKDGDKRTFNEWLDYALRTSEETEVDTEEWSAYDDIYFSVKRIWDTSKELSKTLLNHQDNKAVSLEYRRNVKHISAVASCVLHSLDENEWEMAKRTIVRELVPSFLTYNPSEKDLFLQPYSEDRFTE